MAALASRKKSAGVSRRRASKPAGGRPSARRKTRAQATPIVVGIGASAGGLEALKAFFGAMPPRTGLAFVVVVHLDPTHESLMPELLARSTTLSVEAAKDRQPIEAEHVYIIPPNRTLTIGKGLIRVQQVVDRRDLRGGIDHFFRSLAESQRDRAIGIVLSGSGTEGTLGGRAIKAEGGMVLAQSPDAASQPGMPASVIATGLVDLVLSPDEMPAAILDYVRHAHRRQPSPPAVANTASSNGLQAILAVLRARKKHDFRGYKKGTLQRRIERRMGLRQIQSVSKYVDFLRSHPGEADHLVKDLLISVTSFFRDAAAFEELAKVLAGLVKNRDQDTPIRIWVPGCATGEEAYSIAMVLAEQISAARSACRMQIFATDVDEHALEAARGATYPESIALDVSPSRLKRFFTREDHRYTIVKSIRESVTFACQNLITDPPFSKLDLVSCRNVLIYLEPAVHDKLIAMFHFALNPGGYLFLGSAEGIGSHETLFTPISKRRRLFRRLGPVRRPPLDFAAPYLAVGEADHTAAQVVREPTAAELADQQLLAHFAPAAVVVRRTGQIVRFYGAMDRYMRLPAGDATLDLLTLAREPLKPMLRAALYDSVRHNRQKVADILDVTRDKRRATIRITVQPLGGPAAVEPLWLLIFQEVPATPRATVKRTGVPQADLVRQLDAELRATRKEQQQLVEQLEGSNEELKAANEEILSMNEELQSTNEELVTSKEELQSMNEELNTLNTQLHEKVQELTVVNDDLANLLVSTDIVTVFLDTEFRIKRFTTAATQVLNLLPSDVGRPIEHITTNLSRVNLAKDAKRVMVRGKPVEREAVSSDGKQYLLRVLPYRSSQARTTQGVVLTLVDVTFLKTIERDLRTTQNQLEQLNATLEQRVAERTKWLTLMHDVTRAINDAPSWDEGLRLVLSRICAAEQWQVGYVYLPDRKDPNCIVPVIGHFDDERFRRFHAASEHRRYTQGQNLPARVYADGTPVWVNGEKELLALLPMRREAAQQAGLKSAAVLPIRFGRDMIAVLELFSDQPHEPSDVLADLMNDVSAQIGKVLDRERSTAHLAELVWREQQGLLHTLHDSLGQTLTGIGMLSAGLSQRMADADEATAGTARQVAEQAQVALEQVRQLSRGLYPVEIEADGLLPALRALAATTVSFHKIRVQVEGDATGEIRDSRLATQLYRIAQEAVTNAVKHAHAQAIRIQLTGDSGMTKLRVVDDGVGIQEGVQEYDGLGLRIMRYRATSIGAVLSIDRDPKGGTVVTCTLRTTPAEVIA